MKITDDDIERVEKIFFPNGGSFKDAKNERYNFIKCIDKSIHLQACPGSGKTTALLAKIYLLSEKMPFENNKGICVLTHTNVAIDIIKKRLGNKADKLFTHPNFFGTIQSFVDKFLAIPAYTKIYGNRLKYIDNEMFLNRVYLKRNIYKNNNWLINNKGSFDSVDDFVANFDVSFDRSGFNLVINNLTDKNSTTYKTLESIYKEIIENGYIRYRDAYSLAKFYLGQYPHLTNYFSSRFNFVFTLR